MSSTEPSSLPLLHPDDAPGRSLRITAASDGEVRIAEAAAARFTSLHRHELSVRLGRGERFTGELPGVAAEQLQRLDPRGTLPLGAIARPGDVLVGRVKARDAAGRDLREVSLRCPPTARGAVVEVRLDAHRATVVLEQHRPLRVGDALGIEGSVRTLEAIVPSLGDDDLTWPGVHGERRVEKMVCAEDLLEARSIGPYSLVTQRPLVGKERRGGQRVDGHVRASLEARGAWFVAHELQTVKSDDVAGRAHAFEAIVRGRGAVQPGLPEGARTLLCHLEALALLASQVGEAPSEAADVPLALSLSSTEVIRARSSGLVTRAETISIETLLPVDAGPFCQRIFGPVRDHRCACGRYTSREHHGVRCETCGVEVLPSKVRRERFGHLELAFPVLHPWLREPTCILLGLGPRELDDVLEGRVRLDGSAPEVLEHVGAREIAAALATLDLAELAAADDERAILARQLSSRGRAPASFVFDAWPVLPAELRPLVPLDDGRFATSDLNDLYRRVIHRSERIARLREMTAPLALIVTEVAALQAAVDALVENGARGEVRGPNDRKLVSLGALVLGERAIGTTLSHKAADYSGSAVAVRCDVAEGRARLPRTMALELFEPWIYARLEEQGHVDTIKRAKQLVREIHPQALEALEMVVRERPVVVVPVGDRLPPVPVAALEIELWDELAVGLAEHDQRWLGLAPERGRIDVHVPIDDRAVHEARTLLAPSGTFELERAPLPGGWVGELAAWCARPPWERATPERCQPMRARLIEAALVAEVDPLDDAASRAMLGRLGPFRDFS